MKGETENSTILIEDTNMFISKAVEKLDTKSARI